jgi:hypothetical protein
MKTPRIDAFIPKKKPVPALKSTLDNMPAIEKPTPSSLRPLASVPERENARSPVRPNGKRIITRNSFEIYEDQMNALRKLSLQEKMEGKLGSMSQMVRDAIDSYLEKKTSEKDLQ